MNLDGTPLVVDPKDKGEVSSEVKSFTSQDLEQALAKQKEEHDASLEALVQMRLATLTTMLAPLLGGAASRPTVPTPSLGQQPPSNEHSNVPWLYAKPQVEKPKYNPQGKPPLLDDTADFALWRVGGVIFDMGMMRCWRSWSMVTKLFTQRILHQERYMTRISTTQQPWA